ncbi:MAG: hypothetical protein OEO79_13110 [Gemmatimonadota bacterium]|nr:hypothetical protein [Gemmatimonadota bacterium]MDH3422737.1 hypothetical protein [Gemmatimonadota bacterium]
MGLELWVGAVAVFVSGGAIGAAGTLLAQWLVKKVDGPPSSRQALDAAEMDVLRSEVAEIGRHMRNLDARLDFTERLLDGALPLSPPPGRLDEAREEEREG